MDTSGFSKDYQEHLRKFYDYFESPNKIDGFQKWNFFDIEKKANDLLSAYNQDILFKGAVTEEFLDWIEKSSQLKIYSRQTRNSNSGKKKILGRYDAKNKSIFIEDENNIATGRYVFIFARLIGHFYLHSNLKINGQVYNDFEVTEDNWLLSKHKPKNEKEQIEWQANQFAFSFIMPQNSVKPQVALYHIKYGGNGRYPKGIIHPDYCDSWKLKQIASVLCVDFGVNRDVMKYRLNVVYHLLMKDHLILEYIDFDELRNKEPIKIGEFIN